MATKLASWRGRSLDPRLELNTWDGGGDRATFDVIGHPQAAVEYSEHEDLAYRWTPVRRDSRGRMLSGMYNSYRTACDAVEAILDGSAWS